MGYSFVDSFGPGGVESGAFSNVGSVAVEQSTGDVLVLDAGTGSLYRFDAAGEPAEFPFVKADVIEGVGGSGEGLSEVAVDNSTGPASGDIYITTSSALLVYSESGEKLGELSEHAGASWGIPCGVAVDAAGDVYVGLGGFPGVVNEYVPHASPVVDGDYVSSLSGVPLSCDIAAGSEGDVYLVGYPGLGPAGVTRYAGTQFGTAGQTAAGTTLDGAGSTVATDSSSGEVFVDEHVEAGAVGQVAQYGPAAVGSPRLEVFGGKGQPGELTGGSYGVAVNTRTGTVYASQGAGTVDVFAAKIAPDVVTGPAPKLADGEATLTGTVDPDGTTLTGCEFEYGTEAGVYIGSVECSPEESVIVGSAPVAVSAKLTGLKEDVVYHFRLVAGNSEATGVGHDQVVDVPPIVEGESVLSANATGATLQAQVNPAGTSTVYRFEYDTSEYTGSAPHGTSVPLTSQEIGAEVQGVSVTVHVQGLLPGTVYHYRVVASNEVQGSQGADRTFTTQQIPTASGLPDGRVYELVSPPDKHGGEVLGLGAFNAGGMAQAAEAGDAVTYMSFLPFEAQPPANANGQQFLSTRGTGGWSTQDISAPVRGVLPPKPNAGGEYHAFSSGLSRGLEIPFELEDGESPVLSAEEPEKFSNVFLWERGVAGFQPLFTKATPFTKAAFRAEDDMTFEGAPPDLNHIVVSSKLALTGNSQPVSRSEENLYEWGEGDGLQLVNILPDGKTTVEEDGQGAKLGAIRGDDGRNAISSDGSVVWSAEIAGQYHIYETDVLTGKSVQVDAPQGGTVETYEGEHPYFETASVDGSKVFFTSNAPLTGDSDTGPKQDGDDLYEYDVKTGSLTDLTVDPHLASDRTCPWYEEEYAFCGAKVQGVIGASEDGSYVYVVANGALAPGVSSGSCRREERREEPGSECNLYLLHYNGSSWTTSFIARLPEDDQADWGKSSGHQEVGSLTARVSPNGRYLAFVSLKSLTGYDNMDAVSGQPDTEVYLYDAQTGRLICTSCNPTGARPRGQLDAPKESFELRSSMDPEEAWGEPSHWLSGMLPGWERPRLGGEGTVHQPRYLSDEGRLFFDSTEALVPQDTNGRVDVYEYEPQGIGSCASEQGCVYLISGGAGSQDSTFVDASANGDDVFFVTASRLVPQDVDGAFDMYDAHACTAGSPCFPAALATPPACSSADACRPSPTPQPSIFGAPASATFAGPGNPPPAAAPVGKPAVRKSRAKKKQKGRKKRDLRRRRGHRARGRSGVKRGGGR